MVFVKDTGRYKIIGFQIMLWLVSLDLLLNMNYKLCVCLHLLLSVILLQTTNVKAYKTNAYMKLILKMDLHTNSNCSVSVG